jgi:hypothetical protein
LDVRSGGNPQTQELHKRAVAQYDEQIKECTSLSSTPPFSPLRACA